MLSDGGRLDDGGSRWGDELSLVAAHGPADLSAVGCLVAGLTWDMGGLCPWAGVLSGWISPCTSGWFHPCPWPVLLPEGSKMHQYVDFKAGLPLSYRPNDVVLMLKN